MRRPKRVEVTTQAELDALPAGDLGIVRAGFFIARGDRVVVARGSSSVEAWGSSRVEARESSRVVARESSSVEARESSRVVARGSSRVEARGSSSVEARGSSRVEASDYVAIQRHGKTAKVNGGVLIQIPDLTKPKNWLAYHGINVDDGIAILYKAVRDDFKSAHGALYAPSATPIADDFKPTAACGNGLHFSPHPRLGLDYDTSATRFVACPVRVSKIVVIDETKVKAPKVEKPGCVEVNRDGDPV